MQNRLSYSTRVMARQEAISRTHYLRLPACIIPCPTCVIQAGIRTGFAPRSDGGKIVILCEAYPYLPQEENRIFMICLNRPLHAHNLYHITPNALFP